MNRFRSTCIICVGNVQSFTLGKAMFFRWLFGGNDILSPSEAKQLLAVGALLVDVRTPGALGTFAAHVTFRSISFRGSTTLSGRAVSR